VPDDLTALRLDRLSRDYTAASRFNTNHAPPGSATGGQFTSASGAKQQPAKDQQKARPHHGPTKHELLATAAADRKRAEHLQHELAVLEQEQRDAAKAAAKAAKAAAGSNASGGAGGGAAAKAAQAAQHRKQAAQHRNHAHHHRRAGSHTKANHHAAAAHHHTQAATLLERIAALKVRIHELLDAAAKATAQANRM
jgi:hypothetical protein